MFKAEIKFESLHEMLGALNVLITEACLNITENGISVKAVDPANVAMVAIDLSCDAFVSYQATDCVLAVDTRKLSGALEIAGKGDIVGIELDEENHKLAVRVRGVSYTLSLLSPESVRKDPKIPKFEFACEVTLPSAELKTLTKASEKISDYVYIGHDEGGFFALAVGDTDDLKIKFPADKIEIIKSGMAKAMYALDYIHNVSKTVGIANVVNLQLKTDFPLRVSFKIAEGHGNVEYTIAPRVEST